MPTNILSRQALEYIYLTIMVMAIPTIISIVCFYYSKSFLPFTIFTLIFNILAFIAVSKFKKIT